MVDDFRRGYHTNVFCRPSCYDCKFKGFPRIADITIADYWGIEKAAPEFDDNKGVSLVLINTDRGKELFEKIKSSVVWKETRLEDSMQNALHVSYPEPETRKLFWKDFYSKDFTYIAKKYGGLTPLWRKAARKAKRGIKKFLSK
ncbi:MAG: Coenzyme F420 hydrogenase/dehydrogenase, beta subunit C-terminal domain, partial [Ruminiclostridium sp.]